MSAAKIVLLICLISCLNFQIQTMPFASKIQQQCVQQVRQGTQAIRNAYQIRRGQQLFQQGQPQQIQRLNPQF